MHVATYFKSWLAVPIIVPLVHIILIATHVISGDAILVMVLMATTFLGGIPYLILAAALLWYSRRVPVERFLSAIWISPLLIAVITLIEVCLLAAYISLSKGSDFSTDISAAIMTWVIGCVMGVPLAYVYVLAAYLGYKLLLRLGYIQVTDNIRSSGRSI